MLGHPLPRLVVKPYAEPQLEDPQLYSGTTPVYYGSYIAPLPPRRSIPSPPPDFSSKRRHLNLGLDFQAHSGKSERRPNPQQNNSGSFDSYSAPAPQPSYQYPHHGQQKLRSALKGRWMPRIRRVVSFNPRAWVIGGDFINIFQAEEVKTNMHDQSKDLLFDDRDSDSPSVSSSGLSRLGNTSYLKSRPRSVRYSSGYDIIEWLAGTLVEHEIFEPPRIVIGGHPDELEAQSYSMASLRPSLPIITTQTPAEDAFEYLVRHGCPDLSSSLDLSQCSNCAIAGGRFGDVWKGKFNNNAIVAIKCLRLHAISAGSAKNVKRTARELYNWSKAKHSNVLELLGIAMFKGQLAMLSLWMENGTLSIYASLTPLEQRWSLCLQVTEGLTYMHNIGMVHGDLKAINVLVSGEGVVKLSDFGNSILSDCSLGFTATSNIGGGTTRWMAPELLEDDAQRSTAADVYALGMTILEVMTGRVPYCERPGDISVLNAIIMGKVPVRPTEIETNTRHGNQRWDILLSCWNKNSQKRVNCRAVRDKVRSFL